MVMFSEMCRKLTVPKQAYHYSTKTRALSFIYGLVIPIRYATQDTLSRLFSSFVWIQLELFRTHGIHSIHALGAAGATTRQLASAWLDCRASGSFSVSL